VRGWRAALDAQHSESQRRIARLSALAKDTSRITEARAALTSILEELALKEPRLASAVDNRLHAEMELRAAEKRLAQAIGERTEAQLHVSRLTWIRTAKPEYAELLQRHRDLTRELSRSSGNLQTPAHPKGKQRATSARSKSVLGRRPRH